MPSPDDLLLAPDFVLAMSPKFNTLVSTSESGIEQRRALRATPLRSWKLTYSNRSQADCDTILALFTAMKGQYASFLWTNLLDDVQYNVRFATDNIEFQLKAYQIFDFSFDLQEVRV
jgi:phage-related protein